MTTCLTPRGLVGRYKGLRIFESRCSIERQMPGVCSIAAVVLGSVTVQRGWRLAAMKKLLIYEGMWTTMQEYRPICLAASHMITHTHTQSLTGAD
jgi:hypothetical protein